MKITADVIYHIMTHIDDVFTLYNLCKAYPKLKSVVLTYQHRIFNNLQKQIDSQQNYSQQNYSQHNYYKFKFIDIFFIKFNVQFSYVIEESDNFRYQQVVDYINIYKYFDKLEHFYDLMSVKKYITLIYSHKLKRLNILSSRIDNYKTSFNKLPYLFLTIGTPFDHQILMYSILTKDKRSFRLMIKQSPDLIKVGTFRPFVFELLYYCFVVEKIKMTSVISHVMSCIDIVLKLGAKSTWITLEKTWDIPNYIDFVKGKIN